MPRRIKELESAETYKEPEISEEIVIFKDFVERLTDTLTGQKPEAPKKSANTKNKNLRSRQKKDR